MLIPNLPVHRQLNCDPCYASSHMKRTPARGDTGTLVV